jgi:DNA-binding MarR family transcriptional regulator/ribosomal protein S18 acetylase RimI-like enzyme
MTSPQLVFLKEIGERDSITIGQLAQRTSLSCATATGIVDRLEQRGLVLRSRNGKDRRQVQLTLTPPGRDAYERRPPALQETFLRTLEGLPPVEKQQMLASLRRLAGMMSGIVDEHLPEPLPAPESEAPPLAGKASPAGFLESCRMLLAGSSAVNEEDGAQAGGNPDGARLILARTPLELAEHVSLEELAGFLHEHLKPYEDPEEAVRDGLDYALSDEAGKGGFVLLAMRGPALAGALVMLNTGMHGYVPSNLLLFIAVDAACRRQGIGMRLIRQAQSLVSGDIKLHVEYENPARRLYEKLGFTSKYAEMRWAHEPFDG